VSPAIAKEKIEESHLSLSLNYAPVIKVNYRAKFTVCPETHFEHKYYFTVYFLHLKKCVLLRYDILVRWSAILSVGNVVIWNKPTLIKIKLSHFADNKVLNLHAFLVDLP